MKLYENIKNRRIELNMTQEELAEKMGYKGKSMICKIEKGLVDIPQSKIESFASVLETTPAYLMGWTDNENDHGSPLLGTAFTLMEVTREPALIKALEIYLTLPPDAKQHVLDTIQLLAGTKRTADKGK